VQASDFFQKRAFFAQNGRWIAVERLVIIIVLAMVFFPLGASAQQNNANQTLRGHIPPAIGRLHLQPLGNLPATNRLNLAINLPLRDVAGLDTLIAQIYDPTSPNYHQYLTPEQFTEQFGPSEQDYQAVIAFFNSNGLPVSATYSNRTLVDVSGSVDTIQKVFHVTLRTYAHPTENRTFYAPDTDPVIGLGIPIAHVIGLNDFNMPHPLSREIPLSKKASGAQPATGSGPSGTYMGKDFRNAYIPGVTLNGAGQTVALFELDGYFAADITSYEQQAGLPNVPISRVSVDGGVRRPGSGVGEVSLDIEMAISMATNLAGVIVYEAPNVAGDTTAIDELARIASDNLAKQISSSWLLGDDTNYDGYYKQMASQGQSFFQASGDDGAFYAGIQQWADDTNITLVGGTTLTNSPTGAWSSEAAWNWSITAPPNTGATGGGINFNGVPIPSWQQGIDMTVNQGSTTLRNVPDVALTADNVYVIYKNGQLGDFGGTSCAAPLWAAFTALVNQQAAANGLPPVGFINPAVYAIGKSAAYRSDFHDITIANNSNGHAQWSAVPGYDLCTGWGTPNGQNLINALAPPAQISAAIKSVTKNTFSLTWNSVSNLNYVVQYSTDLTSGNWINLSTNKATGKTLAVTNPIGATGYRFYRIRTQ
jgi:subtilase family serine protease